MKIEFNHKNTKESLLKDDIYLEIDSESIWLNKKTVSKELSLNELKTILENNELLNYKNDFLSLDGKNDKIPNIIKINLVDNINIPISENIFEHYDRNTGEITITEKLLFNEQFLPNTFPEHLYASVGQSKLLIFAILHEIGHAIHHQLFLKQNNNLLIPSNNDFNNNDFLNLVSNNGLYLLGKNEINKKYDVNHAINYSIKEGFADLYACIGLTQTYPKEIALSFINEVIQARKVGDDNYYTTKSLNQFKYDFENNILRINSFEDVHQYIDQTISKTALKTMLEKLNSTNEEQIKHNNAFGGFLKSIIKKSYEQSILSENPLENSKSINEVIQILELDKNELSIKLNKVKENEEIFIQGYETTNNSIIDLKDVNFLSSKLINNTTVKIIEVNDKLGLVEYQEKSKINIKDRILIMRENVFNFNENNLKLKIK